jgi:2-polyprenyl-3-methyl-5-hydroxy-6-metoxy-1,4-benzoquinol methylase
VTYQGLTFPISAASSARFVSLSLVRLLIVFLILYFQLNVSCVESFSTRDYRPHFSVRCPYAQTFARSQARRPGDFSRYHNRKALRAVQALPENACILDDREIDVLLLTVHWEMQRLAEEFYHGHRVWALLRSVVASIRKVGVREKLHIIDVGCSIGYTSRWLAAKIPLADYNIELAGMDLNSTLIVEANRLASAERLPCQFFQGDAFSGEHSNHIILSTGVIHHFRGNALLEFLRQHEHPEALAFLHFDFQPWFLAPFGSLFFHYLRMRTAIARHDGVLSTARAHDADTLTQAARTSVPGFATGIYGAKIWRTAAPRVFHTLVGLRHKFVPEFRRQLGRSVSRLEELR